MLEYFDFLRYFPENVSTFGAELDSLFAVIWYISLAIFALTYGILIYALIKYRHQPGRKAWSSHGSNVLEFTWTILPTFLFAGLGIYCDSAWEKTKNEHRIPKPDFEVEVLGKQFNWMFRYPGADGVLGTPNIKIRTTLNPCGLDFANDPASRDDIIVENDLNLPINKNILVRLTTIDVIHSFFLPNFRVKQDALPGNWMKVWFNGMKVGKYEIACAELCGASHYNMRGVLFMHSQEKFNAWYDEMIKAKTEQMAIAAASPTSEPAPKADAATDSLTRQ